MWFPFRIPSLISSLAGVPVATLAGTLAGVRVLVGVGVRVIVLVGSAEGVGINVAVAVRVIVGEDCVTTGGVKTAVEVAVLVSVGIGAMGDNQSGAEPVRTVKRINPIANSNGRIRRM
jgi:hypothetical protein